MSLLKALRVGVVHCGVRPPRRVPGQVDLGQRLVLPDAVLGLW